MGKIKVGEFTLLDISAYINSAIEEAKDKLRTMEEFDNLLEDNTFFRNVLFGKLQDLSSVLQEEHSSFRQKVNKILLKLAVMLEEKNIKYGNSVGDPLRIFSKASVLEQIRVRIDDKLSRIFRGENDDEDTIFDLVGYLILYIMYRDEEKIEKKIKEPIHLSKILNYLEATTYPNTHDDSNYGYSINSIWKDITTDKTYTCFDASKGKARWEEIEKE